MRMPIPSNIFVVTTWPPVPATHVSSTGRGDVPPAVIGEEKRRLGEVIRIHPPP